LAGADIVAGALKVALSALAQRSAKFGASLTGARAICAGYEDSTIPARRDGVYRTPPGWLQSDAWSDPSAGETPLSSIIVSNAPYHVDKTFVCAAGMLRTIEDAFRTSLAHDGRQTRTPMKDEFSSRDAGAFSATREHNSQTGNGKSPQVVYTRHPGFRVAPIALPGWEHIALTAGYAWSGTGPARALACLNKNPFT
jgi:hypothetical protein